jgi:predicted GIY-YIG superfamily endonuclease
MNRRASADTIRINDQRFWYTYLLVLSNGKYYTGYTKDIKERLFRHNTGMVPYTSPHRPVRLIFYCAFSNKYLAIAFEKYLKSGSGRAFMNKRLIG